MRKLIQQKDIAQDKIALHEVLFDAYELRLDADYENENIPAQDCQNLIARTTLFFQEDEL